MAILNERIKEMRLSHNLTLLDVAEKLKVKEATVQRYESGEIKNIKHETILALSDIFHCSPSYLMGWIDTMYHTTLPESPTAFTQEEKSLVSDFRSLSRLGKEFIKQSMVAAVTTYRQKASPEPKHAYRIASREGKGEMVVTQEQAEEMKRLADSAKDDDLTDLL